METNILKKSEYFEDLSDSDWLSGSATSTMNSEETLSEGFSQPQPISLSGREGTIVISFQNDLPPWLNQTIGNMEELLRLPENWDSYGAPTISLNSVATALQGLFQMMENDTLPPAVVPTSHGGIQVEWHTRGVDLEMEFSSAGDIKIFAEDQKIHSQWEGDFSTYKTQVKNLISRLST